MVCGASTANSRLPRQGELFASRPNICVIVIKSSIGYMGWLGRKWAFAEYFFLYIYMGCYMGAIFALRYWDGLFCGSGG